VGGTFEASAEMTGDEVTITICGATRTVNKTQAFALADALNRLLGVETLDEMLADMDAATELGDPGF
jgi:hypothetical protein